MNITVIDGLPYVTAMLTYRGRTIQLERVLIDTGSEGTLFSGDRLLEIGLTYDVDDVVHRIHGTEFIFTKHVDSLSVGGLETQQFEIEVGLMSYGFEINGLIGMDFLRQVKAIVDLAQLTITPSLTQ